jgi:hypothetical protein
MPTTGSHKHRRQPVDAPPLIPGPRCSRVERCSALGLGWWLPRLSVRQADRRAACSRVSVEINVTPVTLPPGQVQAVSSRMGIGRHSDLSPDATRGQSRGGLLDPFPFVDGYDGPLGGLNGASGRRHGVTREGDRLLAFAPVKTWPQRAFDFPREGLFRLVDGVGSIISYGVDHCPFSGGRGRSERKQDCRLRLTSAVLPTRSYLLAVRVLLRSCG